MHYLILFNRDSVLRNTKNNSLVKENYFFKAYIQKKKVAFFKNMKMVV